MSTTSPPLKSVAAAEAATDFVVGSGAVARADDVDVGESVRRDRWAVLLVIGVAAGIILPLLGATGFFDPWETNYGEVARQMIVRDDYLYPFWKDAHFFSKPILLFWLTAPLYALLGAGDPGPMPWGIEFVGRLPSALIGIATVVGVFVVARQFWSRRAATLSAIVLATSPMWAFLSRQAITDMPYVGLSSLGLLLLVPLLIPAADGDGAADPQRWRSLRVPRWLAILIVVCIAPQFWEIARSGAFFDRVTLLGGERITRVVVGLVAVAAAVAFGVLVRRRGNNPLLLASALCFALSMLAKGPVGFVLSVIVVVVVALLLGGVSGLMAIARWPSLLLAVAVFVLVAAPWPLVMLAYDGLDESRKTWFQRFVLYDLLGRVGAGVHGDRGGLEYYVRVLGFGMVPWAGFVPVAVFQGLLRLRDRPTTRADGFVVVAVVWFFTVFLFFAATTTKFHHYALPAIVPAALLVGLLLDQLTTSSARAWLVVGGFSLLASVVVVRELSTAPWEWIDLFTYHYKGYKPEYYFPVDTIDTITLPVGAGLAVPLFRVVPVALAVLAFGLPLILITVWWWRGGEAGVARSDGVVRSLFDLDGERGIGAPALVGVVLGAVLFTIGATQIVLARSSAHWSQRWLVDTYHSLRQGDEPLIAFQMDWKGETFYAKNREIQIKKNTTDLKTLLAEPGREFVLVQSDRFAGLKTAIGRGADERITVLDRSNAKWMLVLVD